MRNETARALMVVFLLLPACSSRRGDDDDAIGDGDADADADADADGDGDGDADGDPQIQAHQNPVGFGNFPVAAEAETFQLILMNIGGGVLDITSIEVRGDVHCALSPEPTSSVPLPAHLTSSDQAFLQMTYLPGGVDNGTPGTEDQISVVISSNSREYPELEISVCGCVIAEDPLAAPPCNCDPSAVPDLDCGQ